MSVFKFISQPFVVKRKLVYSSQDTIVSYVKPNNSKVKKLKEVIKSGSDLITHSIEPEIIMMLREGIIEPEDIVDIIPFKQNIQEVRLSSGSKIYSTEVLTFKSLKSDILSFEQEFETLVNEIYNVFSEINLINGFSYYSLSSLFDDSNQPIYCSESSDEIFHNYTDFDVLVNKNLSSELVSEMIPLYYNEGNIGYFNNLHIVKLYDTIFNTILKFKENYPRRFVSISYYAKMMNNGMYKRIFKNLFLYYLTSNKYKKTDNSNTILSDHFFRIDNDNIYYVMFTDNHIEIFYGDDLLSFDISQYKNPYKPIHTYYYNRYIKEIQRLFFPNNLLYRIFDTFILSDFTYYGSKFGLFEHIPNVNLVLVKDFFMYFVKHKNSNYLGDNLIYDDFSDMYCEMEYYGNCYKIVDGVVFDVGPKWLPKRIITPITNFHTESLKPIIKL